MKAFLVKEEREKRKEKRYTLNENIRNHLEDTIGGTHLETPSKRTKLVQKQLTFSTGHETTNIEKSKKKRNRQKVDDNQTNDNSGLSPEEQEMSKSSSKRRKIVKKSPIINLSSSSSIMSKDGIDESRSSFNFETFGSPETTSRLVNDFKSRSMVSLCRWDKCSC